uniref:Uncharacterized protein n=1 Tax=Anguilla anguilla TaxID=7936 RepID=A0A0E9QMP5_ANGAN
MEFCVFLVCVCLFSEYLSGSTLR